MMRFEIFWINIFVTLFTLTSVHCAERRTEINNVETFLLFKGTLILGKFYLKFLQ